MLQEKGVRMLPKKETLEIEFKSDRNLMSDNDIVDVVVGLANTNGGFLYIGIEDDGEVTGINSRRTNLLHVAAMIANKTTPSQAVQVELIHDVGTVIQIQVTRSSAIVGSTSGRILRRRLKADGAPEQTPMYPHEFATRLSSLSLFDYSAQVIQEASLDDLDPVERSRLRNLIQLYRGDAALLDLQDDELDRALQFVRREGDRDMPTVAGLLTIGRENSIKRFLPSAGLSFQVLHNSEVRMNETLDKSILATFEVVQDYMKAWNTEQEMMTGFYRMSIPEFDPRAFREAIVNAFSHRDYSILQRVRVQIDDDGMQINSPGGFLEGISLDMLLSTEPRSRNPALADALKRIGLAERTGRGVDRIYEGSLQYGRPIPNYLESDSRNVRLVLPRANPDVAFVRIVSAAMNNGMQPLNVYGLMILYEMRKLKRASIRELEQATHLETYRIAPAVQKLLDAGLLETVGSGRGLHYVLSAKVYSEMKNETEYVRQTDTDRIRYPELVLKLAKSKKELSRADVIKLLNITPPQAYRLLKKMVDDGMLDLHGTKSKAVYTVKGQNQRISKDP